jgi:quercetin dioxygenase-like cupin family protein
MCEYDLKMIKDPKPELSANVPSAQVVLSCPNLAEALDFYISRLGFRVEMIVPADSPRTAVVSGCGVTLRLESETEVGTTTVYEPEFVVNRHGANDQWNEGRAGMQYRDLIPGRLGGRLIASHIRIPEGGETADYVHYHKVRFQMIYCKAGWVRVVYEDQGPAFILQAGDCVLQPPGIRHRVLVNSPGVEVIEIASPAAHGTYADHYMQLPTPHFLPERLYNDQRFVLHRANETRWTPWLVDGFESCDTGIRAATNGLVSAQVIRPSMNCTPGNTTSQTFDMRGDREFLFLFVLNGDLTLDCFERGKYRLQGGDNCVIPAELIYTLSASSDLEILEVDLLKFEICSC